MLIIETWDGNAINDDTNYKAGFNPALIWGLPKVGVGSVQRVGAWPVFGALQRNPVKVSIFIAIEGSTTRTLRDQLTRWFDPEDETPKELVITDDGTLKSRYVEATGESFPPVLIGDVAAFELFRADLIISGDVRWRGSGTASDFWNLTASAETNVVANSGTDDAYPVYKIEPTTGKTGGYDYRVWVPITWKSTNAGNHYPVVAILDTDALTPAKMQADGDDLRIFSDGVEVQRWLNDMDTVTTEIWFSLDFSQAPSLLLKTAIAGAGDIDSIEFTDEVEVSLLPESGIIYIGTEAFVYTARSLIDAAVTGISRAAKGTTIGAHNVNDVCHWIQHDVYIVYGNAAATAPTQTACLMPIIDLDSTNDSWVFSTFGYPECSANGSTVNWLNYNPITPGGLGGCYTGSEWGVLLPSQETQVIGAWLDLGANIWPGWGFYNPCGIVNVDWADGKKYAHIVTEFYAVVRYWLRGASWWDDQYVIPDPGAIDTWEAWSKAAGAAWDPADSIAITLHLHGGRTAYTGVEAGTVTVTLYATETPDVVVGDEQGNYELSATLTNESTGEAIALEFVMDLNSELEVDTYNKTITWLEDDSRQYQVISFSSLRTQWLKLEPGNNTLRFNDGGTGNVTLTTTWRNRYY